MAMAPTPATALLASPLYCHAEGVGVATDDDPQPVAPVVTDEPQPVPVTDAAPEVQPASPAWPLAPAAHVPVAVEAEDVAEAMIILV